MPRTLGPRRTLIKSRIAELVVGKVSHPSDIQKVLRTENLSIAIGTITTIKQELTQEWAKRLDLDTEAIVGEELAALDELQASLWEKAKEGHLPTIDKVLSIMQHRAKLLGLYAPEQHRVVGQVSIVKAYVGVNLEAV